VYLVAQEASISQYELVIEKIKKIKTSRGWLTYKRYRNKLENVTEK